MKRTAIMIIVVLLFLAGAVIGVVMLASGRGPAVSESDLPPLPAVAASEFFVDDEVRQQVHEAQAAVRTRPTDANANGKLGMLYEIYQMPESALVCFQRAALLAPRQFKWQYLLGRSRKQLGDTQNAIRTLEHALGLRANDVPVLVLTGDAYLELGNLDQAQQAYQRALDVAPGMCAALLGLGRVAAMRDEHEKAVDYFDRALEIAPDHSPVHYALALSYQALGQADKAKRQFQIATSTGRANPDPNPVLSEMFALERGVTARYKQALALAQSGQPAQAVALLRSIIDRNPDHCDAYGLIAQCYVQLGRPDQALIAIDKAVKLNPASLAYLRLDGRLLLEARQFDKARQCYEQVLSLGGQLAEDYFLLGQAYRNLSDPARALDQFEKALDADPTDARVRSAAIDVLSTLIEQSPPGSEQTADYQRRLDALKSGN